MITLELFEHWLAQAPAGHQVILVDNEGGSIEVLARKDPEQGAVYQRALNEQARGRILLENNNFGTVAIMRKAQGVSPMASHNLPQSVATVPATAVMEKPVVKEAAKPKPVAKKKK